MIGRSGPPWALPVALLALCAVLGWRIADEWTRPVEVEPPEVESLPPPEPLSPPEPMPEFELPPVSEFQEVVERPLFSPTRQPPAEGAAPVAAPASELNLELIGVVLAQSEQTAIVMPQETQQALRLALGDAYQGWTLVRIEPDRAIFSRGDQEETVLLSYDRPPPTPSPRERGDRGRRVVPQVGGSQDGARDTGEQPDQPDASN